MEFVTMDIFVLLFLTSITVVFMQTCREFQVKDIIHADMYAIVHPSSCLMDLSLEQCALECLLVTICMSFNHVITTKSTMCTLLDGDYSFFYYNEVGSCYVNIRDWPQDVASTCASRPCADNQRCIPTNPYRCMDIDCGIPPVLPIYGEDTNMNTSWTDTTIGSKAQYMCRDANKKIGYRIQHGNWCENDPARTCNSDSSWSAQDIYCV